MWINYMHPKQVEYRYPRGYGVGLQEVADFLCKGIRRVQCYAAYDAYPMECSRIIATEERYNEWLSN